MFLTVFRIFALLFLPISLWILYSLYDQSIYGIPKIDKIELLKMTYIPKVEKKSIKKIKVKKNISTVLCDANNTHNDLNQSKVNKHLASNKHINIEEDNNESSSNALNEFASTKERVFILGDSMGEGLAYGMRNIKNRFNLNVKSIAKCSTTTYYWLADEELESKIESFKPTLILVVLGTNEWNGVNNGTKLRILKIHNRLEKLNINTVWVTPPVSKATQFYEMVHDIYGNDVYDSRYMDLPRGPDKIHPTLNGYVKWSKKILFDLKHNGII